MSTKKLDSRNRARYHILSALMGHSVTHHNTGAEPYAVGGTERAFVGGLFPSHVPDIGALVKIGFARPSKWYLSWLVAYEKLSNHDGRYLLQSIEDGEVIWWSNVEVRYLPMKVLERYPEWRWTDRQFAFDDLWKKACCKEYLRIPERVLFDVNDGSATVTLREKWSNPPVRMSKKFYNWRSLRLKDLRAFVEEAVANWPKREKPESLADLAK